MKTNETDPDDEQLRALVNGVRQNMALGHIAVAMAMLAMAVAVDWWVASLAAVAVAMLYAVTAAAYWSPRARSLTAALPFAETPTPIDREALERANADAFWRGGGQ